ncbi:hypothetical protein IE53DRAFT_389128 [Violaceomyces palustris]|uniref:Uncharacterized protein n=1 Tax=Violaceomyces palustris TaxID=1673888 RepID=A0ACD0NS43_9BASI|nr:hypothetical protein IE53DRAFT_389128 [Violaceomyces palustris]
MLASSHVTPIPISTCFLLLFPFPSSLFLISLFLATNLETNLEILDPRALDRDCNRCSTPPFEWGSQRNEFF